MKTKYAGIRNELPRLLTALTATTALAGAVFLPTHAEAGAWYTISPASCQAPYLDQAGPMRWHEYFLFNPKGNQATYVICPVNIDAILADFDPGNTTYAFAAGTSQRGASTEPPQCFLTAAGRDNVDIEGFLNVPGGAQTFVAPLFTNAASPRWIASLTVGNDAILATTVFNRFQRNHAILCRLPAGYGITVLGLYVQ